MQQLWAWICRRRRPSVVTVLVIEGAAAETIRAAVGAGMLVDLRRSTRDVGQ